MGKALNLKSLREKTDALRAGLLEFIILFIQAFVMLFAIFDPIATIPIFYALTPRLTHKRRRKIVKESLLVAFIILILFAYGGWIILQTLRITLNDFKIAGGILLLLLAVESLVAEPRRFRTAEPEEIAAVPLGTPLLAGPGSITAVMIMMTFPHGPVLTFLVIIVNILLAWLILANSEFLMHLLGKNGMRVITRILGLLIVAFAVMFIREGITGILSQIQ